MSHPFWRSLGRNAMGLIALTILASVASASVLVESVTPDSALTRAGVEAGDLLQTWAAVGVADVAQPIETPWTFEELRIEQASRGSIQLQGQRRGKAVSFVVEPGFWKAQVRPRLAAEELQTYAAIRRAIEDGRVEEALRKVEVTANSKTNDWQLECWWWFRTGELLRGVRRFPSARTAYERAKEVARSSSSRRLISYAFGQLSEAEQDLGEAEGVYRKLLDSLGKDSPSPLLAARSHTHLGRIAWERGELEQVEEHYLKALEITGSVAPHSYVHAKSLNDAAYLAIRQGRVDVAGDRLGKARRILSQVAPLSSQLSTTFYYLGIVEFHHSRLKKTLAYFQQALEIAQALAPEGGDLGVASLHSALGKLVRLTGDLALAEEYLRRALRIEEEQIPGSSQVAFSQMTLAVVLGDGGRTELAHEYFRRALATGQELNNEILIAEVLGNLANLLMNNGESQGAEEHFHRMLEIERRVSPHNHAIPWVLLNLGRIAEEWEDLDGAESFYQEARTFLLREAPQHIYLKFVLTHLGDLARRRAQDREAEDFYRRALELSGGREASLSDARVRHGLGLTLARRGQYEPAAAEFQRAVAILEEQLRSLGGSRHAEGNFRAQNREIYDDALAAELAAGHPERAFHLLERSRARSLLAMLTERDLDFSLDLPEELITARHDLERRYRQAITPDGQSSLAGELEELARLREEQEGLEARLRRASPRFAALRYPTPHDVAEVRDNLEPGTVLLAYNVAKERTDLFVVTHEAGLVDVVTLPVGSQDLREKVNAYLDLLTKRRDPRSPFFQSLVEEGRALYDLLIAPVAQTIEGGERLLIVPDGALHQVPFAALVRPSKDYLVAWRPLHTVLSATLYAQLRGKDTQPLSGRSHPLPKIAAFGDPQYPSWLNQGLEEIPEPRVRSAVRSGLFDWTPLPHSRREAKIITEFYPRENSLLYLGAAATEEAVRALEPGLEIIHFAVHGHLDDRFPLNSALALTMPERFENTRHNGLLQAWEIFDSLRLDADLVVLSACSTALGQERGGEGLVGLVHAFHYAGARSILASLWNVSDRITTELMIAFHRHLLLGLSKDEALRAAQLELLQGPIELTESEEGNTTLQDATAPYYWAAFRILGGR